MALEDLSDVVREEEGPAMRDQLREERTLWVTDRIADSSVFRSPSASLPLPTTLAENSRQASKEIPEDLEMFYAEKCCLVLSQISDPVPMEALSPLHRESL